MGISTEELPEWAKKQILKKIAEQEAARLDRAKVAEATRTKSNGNKYNAEKVIVDGIEFASRKEANRYSELKLKERAGLISDLKLQVKYELVPTQYYHDGSCARAITYYADFEYKNEYGETVVEDVKGYKDPASVAYRVFTIKKKLMLYRYDITITEV